MASLVTPMTGSGVVSVLIGNASDPAFGSYDADSIQAEITANGDRSIAENERTVFVQVLADGGIDAANLTAAQKAIADAALYWACGIAYTRADHLQKMTRGVKCLTADEFNNLIMNLRYQYCNLIVQLGIKDQRLCPDFSAGPESVHHGDTIDYSMNS